MDIEALLPLLHKLIGTRLRYRDQDCQIIEVLDEGPALVLLCEHVSKVQPNQFGDATRRAPKTVTVPVLNEDRHDYHPEFRALGIAKV